MPEIVQAFTSWPTPIAIVLVATLLMFRRPIAAVIDRARGIKTPGGIEITTTPKQDDTLLEQKEKAAPVATGTPFPQLIIKFDSVLVHRICEGLQSHIASAFKDNATERERYLIRTAADAIATGVFE